MSASTSTPDPRALGALVVLASGALACGLALASGSNPAVEPEPAMASDPGIEAAAATAAPTAAPTASPTQAGVGWAAAVLGPARGHLEPCGCSGGQQGGIDRMASVLASAARGATGQAPRLAAGGVVGVESTGQPAWARAQLETLWEAYGMLGLDAVGLGASDLTLGAPLRNLALLLGPDTVLLASNLTWQQEDPDGGVMEEFHTSIWHSPAGFDAMAFLPAGLTGGDEDLRWSTDDPVALLRSWSEVGLVDPAGSNLVLFEGTRQEATPLAQLLGPRSIVLLVTDDYEATRAAEVTGPEGGARIANLGSRLRQVVRLEGADTAPSYDLRLVTEDVPGDPTMAMYRGLYRLLLASYDARGQVADSKGAPIWDGYLGSESCKDCHEEAYEIWKESLHHQGMETLGYDQRDGVGAEVDPRCVQCHSVGFGFETGYGSQAVPEDRRWADFEGLAGIGCESCHGPGAKHVATEAAADIDLGSEATCYQCHDSENDPHFHFEEDWPLIEHATTVRAPEDPED